MNTGPVKSPQPIVLPKPTPATQIKQQKPNVVQPPERFVTPTRVAWAVAISGMAALAYLAPQFLSTTSPTPITNVSSPILSYNAVVLKPTQTVLTTQNPSLYNFDSRSLTDPKVGLLPPALYSIMVQTGHALRKLATRTPPKTGVNKFEMHRTYSHYHSRYYSDYYSDYNLRKKINKFY